MALTKAEKAARYDALQAAIKFTSKQLRRRQADALLRHEINGADVVGSYSKGLADAYELAAEVLERWAEP